ncbi:MAG: bis(5'-nucleosyl)-tetraphosphatase, partial [Candidatus Hydrothermia bacterium]
GFPKGHLEDGETEEDTALRELAEETGLTHVEMIPDFREVIQYWFKKEGHNIHKRVIFFLARTDKPDLRLSHEHEEAGWFDFDEANRRARYRNQRSILAKAHQRVKGMIGNGNGNG